MLPKRLAHFHIEFHNFAHLDFHKKMSMYMEYLIKRLSTTLTLNSKGIPATEKIRKQSLSSEHMRIKQINKGIIK